MSRRGEYHPFTMSTASPLWRVHLALLFVQLTFGAFHVIGKAVLPVFTPLGMAAIRVGVATPLLLILAYRVEGVLPPRRYLPHLAVLGALGVFANQLLYILGLARTTAANAGILMPSIPVFAALVAAVLKVESIGPKKVIGVVLAVAGATVMLDPSRFSSEPGVWSGNLLILCNCLAYAVFLVLQQPLLRVVPPLTLTAWAFLFGGTATFAVSLPSLLRVDLAEVPASAWFGMAYIVLIPTAVNYVLNAWAVRRSSPSLVATYITLQPVAAALLAVAVLGEHVGLREVIGFVLIAGGLAAIARSRRAARAAG